MSHISITQKRQNGRMAALMLMGLISIAIIGSALAADEGSYQPAQTLGSGDGDWWTAYPSQNAKAGSSVEHPSWILDALKEKPVLILVHSSNCKPCLVQIANMKDILADNRKNLTYYDILAEPTEGGDMQRATELLNIYSPSGGDQRYVPTTIFLTLIEGSDGKVGVAWHSVEDAMSKNQVDAYVKDAIYYHRQNQGDWS